MPKEPAAAPGASDGEASSEDGADIFYVCKKALAECREKLKTGKDIDQALVQMLVNADDLPDDELMVPVDMRGAGHNLDDDIEQMMEKLGAKGTAECIVKCAELFEANKDKVPEEERSVEMTVAEWKKVLEEEDDDDLSEEGEEELDEGDEEEAEAEEGATEPVAKKPKTS